ncbi:MAG TPA: heparan-alpha-glucosaminide N-acetyltransferase domain-containing protein [Thermoanaerobaculia bacterium]|nr:heparan-alpha-glucosaminide N-acetyltransferase domain-containing protein [Thermoanaerobaculia bacterium]
MREPSPGRAFLPPRLDSVDALRGAAIAGMIIVNNPGTWSAVYPPLLHAEWSGWTYTDTIFPFFLFVAGTAMALSFGRRATEGAARGALFRHLAIRAAIILGIGLVLNAIGAAAFHRDHLRLPGVLQRIGVCVLASGAVWLLGGPRASAWAAGLLLAGYWALMAPWPLDMEGNLAARVDRAVFGAHTWKPAFDPEGLLSTLPAIATMLLGTLAGELLRKGGASGRTRVAARLALWGAAGTAAGLLWGLVFPINKSLWTSSYAVLMSGLAALVLGALVEVIDVRRLRGWAAPLLWLGRNAIAAFTLSTLTAIALIAIRVDDGMGTGRTRSLWSAIHRSVFDRFAHPRLGSLLFALAYLAIWTAVFGLLYRRRVFIKI